jgi:hypothetical protein
MTHLKCFQCGLNYWQGAEVCERCGASLEPSQPQATAPERSDVPVFLTLGSAAPARSSTWKVILAVVIVLAVGGGAWVVYRSRSKAATGKRRQLVERPADERTRDAVLSCLAYPGFAGTKVSEQVLGRVHFELLQVTDKEVYFSAPAPEKVGETFESLVGRFITDSKGIVMAEDDGGRLRLGKYSLQRSADKDVFFKTAVDNIRFNHETVLKFPFNQVVYTLDMRELEDFLLNKSI